MNVSEVSRAIGLPRATTFRLLLTLEEEGFVDRLGNTYSLGWDLARIARGVDPAIGLANRVRPIVASLADDLGETVTLSLRQGLYELDVILQESPRIVAVTVSNQSSESMTGKKWPHHASATGKLLLAELEPHQISEVIGEKPERLASRTIVDQQEIQQEIRRVGEQGWGEIDDELEDGIYSLAVPIKDSLGHMIAALAMVVPKHRIDDAYNRDEKLTVLRNGAATLRERFFSATPEE
ncbi:IclR family transcriptional regulator [Rothia halotolerans]|uniref:IclR family transcriptional regulator n=1 Tax=Rothia halotolerans TaxID=405770 RepID=UPI003B50873A